MIFQEGIALQIQDLRYKLSALQEKESALKQAWQSAEENRDLTRRAYQQGLKEVKDLIEAQIYESFMKAQYQKLCYDHFEMQARLEFIIGTEVINYIEK